MVKKLSNIPYGNVRVLVYDDGSIALQSYSTIVAEISTDKWLKIYGLYSATTRKHIGAFMREYCNSNYQLAKQLFQGGLKYNLLTGEVV